MSGRPPARRGTLDYFAPAAEAPAVLPLASQGDDETRSAPGGAAAPPEPEPHGEGSCAFETVVNVAGTLLVVATVLLLLIDRVWPIFLAKP